MALDDEISGYIAVKHLLDMGHQDIIGIFTHSDRQGLLRYKGYMKALMELGLPIQENLVFWYSKENMQQILNGAPLLKGLNKSTAALCYNDSLALMLIDLLKEHGIRVPEDFSVVEIDNCEMAGIRSLTTVVHPAEQLGKASAKLLLSMMNGKEGKSILFPPELIVRNSVQRMKG
ncbi:substrate-binding domain-containing protein [Mobilitalea sibirica]|uniref:Substrate-binding domain-containing protein n=1 Tax=Mobilitalea sibirica TaxID=1462919 RepID=A0A8J7HBT9_9FIRM|nr:substrate-binding domain-containing protein [Mobilitalea sibirica]